MSRFDFAAIQKTFNAVAQDYDRQRQKLIPCFDGFYGTLAAVVDTFAPPAPRVLDLGAGTGLSTAFVAQVRPDAHLTLLDGADAMLAVGRRRFAENQHVEFRVGDYRHLAGPEAYDVIVSALSIHHLTDPEKAALYRNVHDRLAPGGLFVNADQVRGENEALEARQDASWKSAMAASGLPQPAVDAALERVKADLNATLPDNLAWLRTAGFAHATCWFRDQRFAVFGGVKAR